MTDFDFFYISCLLIPIGLIGIIIFIYKYKARLGLKKRPYLVLYNLLITAFLLSILFSIGETYYRFFVDTTDSFAINKISQRWNKRHVKLNNFQSRDNINYTGKIAKGKRRITIFGDSFTSGYGIKDVDKRFGNLIRAKYPNIEVHIFAKNGDNSLFQMKRIQGLIEAGYQFDMVILAYCLNDIGNLMPETIKVNKGVRAFNSQLGFIERNSYFVNMISFRLFALNNSYFLGYSDFVLKAYEDTTWEKQKEILNTIKQSLNEVGSPLIVMTFPFLQKEIDLYEFKEVHRMINDFWKLKKVSNLDLLETYKAYLGKNLTVNKFDAHPNEFANKLAAEAIDNLLQEGYQY
ncbi:MAG: SGNH/GDSL hydrolase family protein [Flavobacteriales bacterium]|nr:SGNH/GDSL hydrolase family protein [Flavobacteriales bacterium]